MRNPIKYVGKKIGNLANSNPLITLVVGSTIALNAAVYALYGVQEGIQRLCGVKTVSHEGRLKESGLKYLSAMGSHGQIVSGTFVLEDGKELEVVDCPVVTEGKFVPNMAQLQEGKKYQFRTFGYNFVDAQPSN